MNQRLRQIKFRAFLGGRMVYRISAGDCPGLEGVKGGDDGCGYECIDPATVMQFTGMTDRNGKEIYEGDILEVREHLPKRLEGGKKTVSFHNGSFGLYNDDHVGDPISLWLGLEVIGNVHQNPPL